MRIIPIPVLLMVLFCFTTCIKKKEITIETDKSDIYSRDTILLKANTNFRAKYYEWKVDGRTLESKDKEVSYLFYTKGKHRVELTAVTFAGKSHSVIHDYMIKPSPGMIKRWFDHSPLYPIKYYYKLALSAKGFTYEGVAYSDSVYLDSIPGNTDYEIFCEKVKFPCIELKLPAGKYTCKFYGQDKSGSSNYNNELELDIDGECQTMNY